jgi:hypothetical protein
MQTVIDSMYTSLHRLLASGISLEQESTLRNSAAPSICPTIVMIETVSTTMPPSMKRCAIVSNTLFVGGNAQTKEHAVKATVIMVMYAGVQDVLKEGVNLVGFHLLCTV